MAAGHITAHKNIPQVTWVANAIELGDKTMYRTLVRTSSLISQVGTLAVTLHRKFNWYTAGMISANRGMYI